LHNIHFFADCSWLVCSTWQCTCCLLWCFLQAFLLRKLKINGSMGLALKLQPILDAAAPRAKL
jgi:hypothetical protein